LLKDKQTFYIIKNKNTNQSGRGRDIESAIAYSLEKNKEKVTNADVTQKIMLTVSYHIVQQVAVFCIATSPVRKLYSFYLCLSASS
jgi:hypothetical protein